MPTILPPLSVYVHIPWCVRKCPYCDFNSHTSPTQLPVEAYLKCLIEDLRQDKALAQGRRVESIFFGGGTPSLFPHAAIAEIIEAIDTHIGIKTQAEITLEANPGTAEQGNFGGFKSAGINRISLGVQSFNDQRLKTLGRIHNSADVTVAWKMLEKSGIDNINIDLMHGLPGQTDEEATDDLDQALQFHPQHISWYQLTIEKNTAFYSAPPSLPDEDALINIQDQGHAYLLSKGFEQYEVSAYSLPLRKSAHNMNYWRFGDYLALGAGAHGKITQADTGLIQRYRKTRQPDDYMDKTKNYTAHNEAIAKEQLPLEFMMNAMRLTQGVQVEDFERHTGLELASISPTLNTLQNRGLIEIDQSLIKPSPTGQRFLNNLLEAFITPR
ncbi:MAG: YggW family oxidoreductase [Alteromonadaceae bacterium]|nr:MAG: YggW family oxidoreductase [Alteromonadaceae bacterium]